MSHTIEPDAFQALVALTQGMEDVRLRSDYVGRGMYGSPCLALAVSSHNGLVRWLLAVSELVATESDDVAEKISGLVDAFTYERVNTDNLGHRILYYWPGVSVEEAPDDQ